MKTKLLEKNMNEYQKSKIKYIKNITSEVLSAVWLSYYSEFLYLAGGWETNRTSGRTWKFEFYRVFYGSSIFHYNGEQSLVGANSDLSWYR